MSKRIDLLNIGLIIISFVLAYLLPVRLFLFSYAILGPLHYLTEIGWLDKRGFFSKKKSDVWILVVLCALLTVGFFLSQVDFLDPSGGLASRSWMQLMIQLSEATAAGVVFFAFAAAIVMVFVSRPIARYITIFLIGIVASCIHLIGPATMLFGVFLPTIIHVSIFTGLFMLYGALKNKSKWGYVSVLLFFLCCFGIFFIEIPVSQIVSDQQDFQMLLDSTFIHIGANLADFLGLKEVGDDYLLLTKIGLQMQMLFAFCYTYHYLNWFSKTKIINWHEVSRSYLIFTGVVWFFSILLYTVNYKAGLLALFFLSMLHVFLEFPLNGLSIVGIFQELKGRLLNKG